MVKTIIIDRLASALSALTISDGLNIHRSMSDKNMHYDATCIQTMPKIVDTCYIYGKVASSIGLSKFSKVPCGHITIILEISHNIDSTYDEIKEGLENSLTFMLPVVRFGWL